MSRIITITGDGISHPAHYEVLTGTNVEELVQAESLPSAVSLVPAAVSWASVWPRPWAFRATTTRSSR